MLGVALAATPCLSASAQSSPEAAQPTAEQRQQAANAFDQGTSAMLSRDYGVAAHWFEQADRLAPNFAALMQAVRANDRAGNELRAANLALRLRDEYPNEAQAQTIAADVLTRFGGRYATIRVVCDAPCTVDVGGALTEHNVFFVTAGREVTVNASFPGGTLSQTAAGAAGAEQTLTFVAPPPPPDVPDEDVPTRVVVENHGASPALFWASVGVTLASGGVLLWSGIDTNRGADRYEAAINAGDFSRAEDLLDAGEKKETRTNVLIALTAGLAAEVGIVAIFTDWGGDDEDEEESAPTARRVQDVLPGVGLSQQGGMLSIQGRF